MARRKQEQPQGDDPNNQDAPSTADKGKARKQKRRGAGEGTVYQRTDGRWVAELTLEDGKRKYYYGKTQGEAIKKLQQAQYEMKQGILATGPKQKLADHLTYWLEQVKKRPLRASTYVRYRFAMEKHILPALGHLPLNKITLRTLQQFHNKKLDEGQSLGSVIIMHNVLNQALKYAVKERLISTNPCSDVSLPSREKRKVQPLTLEQAQCLLKEVQGTMMEPFIALALVVAMRHGELLALRWQDIDLAQGRLTIRHTLTRDEDSRYIVGDHPKTTSSERILLLPQAIRDMLLAHQMRLQEARLKAGSAWQNPDLVFCTRKGTQLTPDNVYGRFYRLLERAGLPHVHIHDLRHSAATLLRQMGVDIKVIQQILGHSTLDMTANVYSHVLPEMQEEAVEKMKNFFEKPS